MIDGKLHRGGRFVTFALAVFDVALSAGLDRVKAAATESDNGLMQSPIYR